MNNNKFRIFAVENVVTGEQVFAWVEKVDFEFADGRGLVTFTTDPNKAIQFDSLLEAMEYWKTQSRIRPRRPDGEPNRPLTAYTVEPTNSLTPLAMMIAFGDKEN